MGRASRAESLGRRICRLLGIDDPLPYADYPVGRRRLVFNFISRRRVGAGEMFTWSYDGRTWGEAWNRATFGVVPGGAGEAPFWMAANYAGRAAPPWLRLGASADEIEIGLAAAGF